MTQDHSALLAQLDTLKSADAGAVFAELIRAGLQALIEAEATETIGAGRYERTGGRGTHRNGHRPKTVSTTAGDIEVQIPKLRAGSFFPSLLERRRRIDRALHAVIMEAYVHGVSTRSVDATFCKVRVGAHVVSQALVVATGVSIDGTREVLGTAVGDSESYEFWREFLASLRARGLTGVHLVISDAHAGLNAAVAQQFTNSSWQRCRVHFMRNLHTLGIGQACPGGDRGGQDDIRSHRPRGGRRAMGPGRRHPGEQLPEGGRDDGRGQDRRPGVHRVPKGALAEDLVEQSDRYLESSGWCL